MKRKTYTRNCEIKDGIEFPDGMHRFALGLEYVGADYHGFQKQVTSANTVQAHLERALAEIAQEEVSLVCAGRTDAGVSASGQVLHFDTLADRPERAWVLGTNTKLPENIRVHWAREAGPQFHARFSARSRTYRYLFSCAGVRPAVLARRLSWFPEQLDIDAMQSAARHLLGEHDFSSFRSSQCQAHSPCRTVDSISWTQRGQIHCMEIRANAFLHHMVRNIVGTLLEVGKGERQPEWIAEVLRARDRRLAGATAQPWGLYLVAVDYDEVFGLPQAAKGPIFMG